MRVLSYMEQILLIGFASLRKHYQILQVVCILLEKDTITVKHFETVQVTFGYRVFCLDDTYLGGLRGCRHATC